MKKRMVSLIVSILMLFSTVSISVYAAPNEGEQTSGENTTTEEIDSAAMTDQDNLQQDDKQEEVSYVDESTNSHDMDSYQEQESLPISIQVKGV